MNTNPVLTERSGGIQFYKFHGRGHKANQCPNLKTLIFKDGRYLTNDEQNSHDNDVDEKLEAEPSPGKLMTVSRRVLTMDVQSDTSQRENLFHSRCLFAGKVLSVIVDRGSCANVVSQEAVDKLGLHTTRHPDPYSLHWLNYYGVVRVRKQARISFEIRAYKDELEFDVAPMQATHLLLGRPW
ncbi:unnamed protein product [Linum trigynum]|uniref:Uncharacterized protein n=1 Tax=Linum trigynum TaxID=586398 RepID=A0AAV2CTG9_9ROSI